MSRTRAYRGLQVVALGAALLAAALAQGDAGATGARTVPAQAPLEIVGHLGGAPRDVVMRDGHAYVATGYALEVWDLRDPARPERVGQLLRRGYLPAGSSGDARMRLRLDGPRAYLADRNMVRIIDISDPSELRELGLYSNGSTVQDVVAAGAFMYVALVGPYTPAKPGVVVVNVSNPAAPVVVTRTDDGGYGRLLLAGNRLVAFGWISERRGDQEGVRVYDLLAPGQLVAVGQSALPKYLPYDAAIQGPYLYAGWNTGLYVYDLSDPLWIHKLAEYPGTDVVDPVEDLVVTGTRAAILRGGVVEIVDVSNPAQPRGLGSLPVTDSSWTAGRSSLAVDSGVAVVTSHGTGVAVVDVADPARMAVLSRFYGELPGSSGAVVARAGRAFVTNGESVRAVDVSDPTKPVPLGTYVPGPAPRERIIRDLALRGDHVLLSVQPWSDDRHELDVLDVSNPSALRRLGYLDLGAGNAGDLVVRGDVAYLASYLYDAAGVARRRLFTVDVSAPSAPRRLGMVEIENTTPGVLGHPELALIGHHALLGTQRGVALIDVSDPAAPILRGQLQDPPNAVTANDAYGYAVIEHNNARSLATLDVADPALPRLLATFATNWETSSLGVSAAHLFGGGASGVQMFDNARPDSLRRLASRQLPAEARALALRDGYAYVADGDAGLFILYTGDADLPEIVPPTATPPTPWTPTASPTLPPTVVPPSAMPSPRPTAPGPTPTAGPVARVCPQILNRVPRPVLDAALANPERVGGWNQLQNPSLPPGPFNARRVWLTLRVMGLPFDLLFNPVLYRASCP